MMLRGKINRVLFDFMILNIDDHLKPTHVFISHSTNTNMFSLLLIFYNLSPFHPLKTNLKVFVSNILLLPIYKKNIDIS